MFVGFAQSMLTMNFFLTPLIDFLHSLGACRSCAYLLLKSLDSSLRINKNNSNPSCPGIIMSSLTENSLTSMKAAIPAAPDPIQGIPKLASLIDLMLHMCRCSQTQKTPASDKMNMLFCAVSPGLYSFFTTEAYPASFFPFPPEVDAVLDFSTCTSDNEHKTLKATNSCDQKT